MKRIFKSIVSLTILISSTPAIAEEVKREGIYLDFGLSSSTLDVDTSPKSFDGSASSLVLGTGYRFNQYVSYGVEFRGIGSANTSFSTGSLDVDGTWWGMNVSGYYPLSEHFELTARLGTGTLLLEQETIDINGANTDETKDWEIGINYSLGATYSFNPSWSMTLEWTNYSADFDGIDVSSDSFALMARKSF